MQKTVYEDYKYSMQDTSRVYVGSKYTLRELLEADEVLFKFRMLVERYILPEADLEDTLETHLYYLSSESFLVKLYTQMKAKVKINVIEEKKNRFGLGRNGKKQYVTKLLTIEQLVKIPPEEKEKKGMVIQELSVSKLALAGM
ncbi:MAG: hypothetical protein HFH82_05900 [Lachnospiraceae bacterium]|nr:hypothetical protein [Lachnospiraceae bacterium]